MKRARQVCCYQVCIDIQTGDIIPQAERRNNRDILLVEHKLHHRGINSFDLSHEAQALIGNTCTHHIPSVPLRPTALPPSCVVTSTRLEFTWPSKTIRTISNVLASVTRRPFSKRVGTLSLCSHSLM